MKQLSRKNILGSNFAYQHHTVDVFLNDMVDLDLLEIELWGVPPHMNIPMVSDQYVRDFARKLKERGMRTHCFTPDQLLHAVNIASGDATVRDHSIGQLKRAAEICVELDGPYLFLIPSRGYEDEPLEDGWKRAVDALAVISDYARGLGIRCLFESLQRVESNLVTNLHEMVRMMKQIDTGNFSVVLDTVAMAVAGNTVAEYFEAFPGKVAHVHLVDGTPAGHLAWGDGNLPMADYVAELEKHGYQGGITFEMFGNGSYAVNPRPSLEKCIASYQETLDQLHGDHEELCGSTTG